MNKLINTVSSYKFTFYYIYIKTLLYFLQLLPNMYLHSTIFILKRDNDKIYSSCDGDLHSTIFILKQSLLVHKQTAIRIYILLYLY